MRVVTRLRQGIRALLAFSQPVDYALAEQYLTTPALMACFQAMRRSEQLHSLNVLRDLLAESSNPIPLDLAIAALLHDCGKSRYAFPTWQKTLVVLVRAGAPGLFERLSAGREQDWLARPFVLSVHHPAWSAELVAAAGASERALWLIAHHADPLAQWEAHPDYALLARLRVADDAN